MESRVTQRKVIVFKLANEEYAVDIHQVGSIEKIQSITRVPDAASFVKGVINLRGVVIPIIDLRTRFGMQNIENTNATRIIIVHVDEMHIGLIVDEANDVIDLEEDKVEPPPEVVGSVNADYVQGVVKYDDRLLILLDLQKVLTTDEMHDLKSMGERQ